MLKKHALWDDFYWLESIQPTTSEYAKLQSEYNLSQKDIEIIQNKHVNAQFKYNEQEDKGLIIWQFNIKKKDSFKITSIPLYIFFTKRALVTSLQEKTESVNQKLNEIIRSYTESKTKATIVTVIFELILKIVSDSVDQIGQFDAVRENLSQYNKRPSEQQIKDLAFLNESLIYLTTSVNQNLLAIQQIKVSAESSDSVLNLKEDELQKLNATISEITQIKEMAGTSSSLTDQISNAYNNILNTSLNDTMRFLTIWSLVFAIPPIVSGFYGQNVALPFDKEPWAWFMTLVVIFLLILTMLLFFNKHLH